MKKGIEFGNKEHIKLRDRDKINWEEKGTFENKCCCCGRKFKASYTGLTAKSMARECDVCPKCYQADCRVMTGEKCNITGKTQVQLTK